MTSTEQQSGFSFGSGFGPIPSQSGCAYRVQINFDRRSSA
jgi:hypothetical protein